MNEEKEIEIQDQDEQTPVPSNDKDEHMIPKSRLDQVIAQKKDLEGRLEKLEAQQKDRETDSLKEKEQYKELYENTLAENEDLKAQIKALKVEKLRSEVAAKYNIPVELVDRIKGETKEEMEKDAESLSGLFKVEPKAEDIDNKPKGRKRSTTGKSDAEKQRLASRYGFNPKYFD